MDTEITTDDAKRIVILLQENNTYLKQLLEFKQKEHRQATIHQVIHIVLTLVPWVVVLFFGYFIWQSVMHYLDALNNNINTLKGNFDTLAGFIQKITADFGSIMPKFQSTWEKISHFGS